MEYDIRFCETVEGRRIAYGILGSGPPVLITPGHSSHLELELESGPMAPILRALASRFQIVRYDRAGTGLSRRAPLAETAEAVAHEVEAVVEHAGLQRFSMLGVSAGGFQVIEYAARHSEHLNRLVFYGSLAMRPMPPPPWSATMAKLAEIDPVLATRQLIEALMPTGGSREYVQRAAQYMVEAGGFRAVDNTFTIAWEDQRELLPNLAAPTLVLHRLDDQVVPIGFGRQLAALLPDARFVALPGANHLPGSEEEALEVAGRIIDFLSEADEREDNPPEAAALQTILFTDLESSTALTQRVGDSAAQEVLHGHNQVVRRALAANGGREVKHTGDGIMAAFGSAVRAVEAAMQIQHDLAGGEVRVRVGLNAGEPIAEDGDFFGSAVQMAARVCDRAEPGQVVVAQVVRDLCRGKGFAFEDMGEVTLKGFPEPERLFQVTITGGD